MRACLKNVQAKILQALFTDALKAGSPWAPDRMQTPSRADTALMRACRATSFSKRKAATPRMVAFQT